MALHENDDANRSSQENEFERLLALLTRENDALRTVLARLHEENIRMAETLLRTKTAARARDSR